MPTSRTSDHDRRWLILAVLGTAQLMVVLDSTIVNIALPSAQKALHFSDTDRQWVVPPTRSRSAACCCSAGGWRISSAASGP